MNKNLRNTTTHTKVMANLLHTGLYFQNEPNKERINQLVDSFDWNRFDSLTVSYRDGKYNVVDGQHRLLSAKVKFGENVQVPCHIRFNLTESEEMELFIDLVKGKRKVHSNEIYKAMYGAGRKPVVDMVNTIRECGLICDFNASKVNGRITAIHTVFTKIYSQLGRDDFKIYLKLLKDAWNGDKESLQVDFMLALLEFFKLYRFDYNEKTFIKKLSQHKAIDIKKDCKSIVGKKVAMVERYNKGLKANKKLELRM